MSKSSVTQCDNGVEMADTAIRQGCKVIRQTGSHLIIELPNGDHESIPQHRRELRRGLRAKIVKHLLAAGLTLLLVVPLLVRLGVL